jgi:hypothetical protein
MSASAKLDEATNGWEERRVDRRTIHGVRPHANTVIINEATEYGNKNQNCIIAFWSYSLKVGVGSWLPQ